MTATAGSRRPVSPGPVPAGWLEPTVHSVYLQMLAQLPDGHGLRQGIDVPAQAPGLHTWLEFHTLLSEAGHQGTPASGAAFGMSIPPAAHGLVGQAVIASPTLGAAFEVLARYIEVRNRLFRIRWQIDKRRGALTLEPSFELGIYGQFALSATLLALLRLIRFLAGRDAMAGMGLHLTWPLDDLNPIATFSGIPAGSVHRTDAAGITVRTNLLAQPNFTTEPRQYQLACEGCEEELAALSGSAAARVKRILLSGGQGHEHQSWLRLTEVAERMAISRRTLVRRLAAEGTSYGEVLTDIRSNLACWYLSNTDLPVRVISERLGFGDESNFSRSFRKWKSTTPLAYRKQMV